MSFTIRPAVRDNVGLFIGVAGGTGSGKTVSAMRIAKGIVGPGKRFAVIDTENRRASHEADNFDFDVLDLTPPYSSARYEEAVTTVYKTGYKAIVLDSGTHEHDGVGGYLDAQATDLEGRIERAKRKNPNASEWDLVDKLTPSSWIAPKRARKHMMQALLACSVDVPVIFCFRAEEKVFQSKDGKLVAMNPPVWAPICGKGMPFEMTVFFMLHRERPGVPVPIKLAEKYKALFPLDQPLAEESGRLIAEWARGGSARTLDATSGNVPAGEQAYINADQVTLITDRLRENAINVEKFCEAAKVKSVQFILAADYQRALDAIEATLENRRKKAAA